MAADLFFLIVFALLAILLYIVHHEYRQKMIGFIPAVVITVVASVTTVYTVVAIYTLVPEYAISG